MINSKWFRFKLESFPPNYMGHFDEFWKRKLKIETNDDHILDNNHLEETYEKLCNVLRKWQTYRGSLNPNPLGTLKGSLEEMSNAYNQIRKYNLLEFGDIPSEPLELIWHELGRVKEYDGNRKDNGIYYIISICKPLMLLWGQTLAFDSRVRGNVPSKYRVPKDNQWSFRIWTRVMESFQRDLMRNPGILGSFKEEALKRYGNGSILPYGRFLDIYYF